MIFLKISIYVCTCKACTRPAEIRKFYDCHREFVKKLNNIRSVILSRCTLTGEPLWSSSVFCAPVLGVI